MKTYDNSYGKTFIFDNGGSITISNYDFSLSSMNPGGLGGIWNKKDADELKADIARIVWITAEEREALYAEIDRVKDECARRSDKNAVIAGYKLKDGREYALLLFNKSGHQTVNGTTYDREWFENALANHPERIVRLPLVDLDREGTNWMKLSYDDHVATMIRLIREDIARLGLNA